MLVVVAVVIVVPLGVRSVAFLDSFLGRPRCCKGLFDRVYQVDSGGTRVQSLVLLAIPYRVMLAIPYRVTLVMLTLPYRVTLVMLAIPYCVTR